MRTHLLEPAGPRYDPGFKEQALVADQDRMSLRGVQRTFGVCYETVRRRLREKTGQLPAFADTLLPSQKGDVLELDELWSFVGAKTQMLWRWVSLCRRTRQSVAWTLGDRSEQGAADLRAALPPAYRRCATRGDLWRAYRAAFPARTHRCGSKHEGETCLVERWFCTLRQRVGRLMHKALAFSKHAQNHLDAIHLFIATYNLQIQRQATKS